MHKYKRLVFPRLIMFAIDDREGSSVVYCALNFVLSGTSLKLVSRYKTTSRLQLFSVIVVGIVCHYYVSSSSCSSGKLSGSVF